MRDRQVKFAIRRRVSRKRAAVFVDVFAAPGVLFVRSAKDPVFRSPDEEFVDSVGAHDFPTTTEIADDVGCKYRTAYERLNRLADEGRVARRKIGSSLVWTTTDSSGEGDALRERLETVVRTAAERHPETAYALASAVDGAAPAVLVTRQNCAKALGGALARRLDREPVVIDEVGAEEGDYLDVGEPISGGEALPVVVKTLAFGPAS